MKTTHSYLRSLIREQLVVVFADEDHIEPADSTDAWHPSDVVPVEDVWSGGDNLDTPLDHAFLETGESNAGNHATLGFSGEPEPLGDQGCGCGAAVDDEYVEFSPERDLADIISLLLEEDGDVDPDEDLGLIDPEEVDDTEIEREDIVLRIIATMSDVGISGEDGMFGDINDADEFEDLVRFIFQDVDIDNRALAGVAMRISRDFLENPETAADMSTFNF